MNTLNSNHKPNQLQLHLWQIVGSWLQLVPDVIKRLPKRLRADLGERVVQSAKSRLAESRRDDMATT